jgi:DNA modification methylase
MQRASPDQLTIINPKRHADLAPLDSRLFPYYAGYSAAFTRELLASTGLTRDSLVLDPWNGAGTTTQAAHRLGFNAIGIDLNPAMVMVAKASLLSPREAPSLVPLAQSIIEKLDEHFCDKTDAEPLTKWLCAENAGWVRQIETAINRTLISHRDYQPLTTAGALDQASPLSAFFYVALFRAIRKLLQSFIPSNPTWVKTPKISQARKRPQLSAVKEAFLNETTRLADSLAKFGQVLVHDDATATVSLGNSEQLSLPSRVADLILSSPPYCTRIDYAMATAIELAILRFRDHSFDTLRRTLMGTSTVQSDALELSRKWGATCTKFLRKLHSHSSKASKTYYFKNHTQYFGSLHQSVQELSRVLKVGGLCILVVQDSHYKEVHNDVPTITTEMAEQFRLVLRRREDFVISRSMVRMNRRARKYLKLRQNIESVLCFQKQ